MHYLFKDRHDAGKQLAKALFSYAGKKNTLLLALPRGGVIIAKELSESLLLPMDLLVVRKLSVPHHEELAMGAITLNHICTLNYDIINTIHIPERSIRQEIQKEEAELLRRNKLYRDSIPFPNLSKKIIILVDDGLATGATMRTAITFVRRAHASSIIVAVPVGATSICKQLQGEADKVICLYTPEPFHAVAVWYNNFTQVTDKEVQEISLYPPIPAKRISGT